MGKSSIEWTEFTTNPFRVPSPTREISGHYCEKVSPGCKNCYASKMQPRFGLPMFQEQHGFESEKVYLDIGDLESVLRRKKPTTYFWANMSDMFGSWIPFEWIAACYGVMAATPWHTHMVLTKRAKRALEFYQWLEDRAGPTTTGAPWDGRVWNCVHQAERALRRRKGLKFEGVRWPLPNVRLGVSVETHRYAEERLPHILACPSACHFVSLEPLLGPVDLQHYIDQIDWGIVGGESGNRARECDIDWIGNLVMQFEKAEKPMFVKQLGRNAFQGSLPSHPGCIQGPDGVIRVVRHPKGGDINEFPYHLRVRQYPETF